MAGPSRGLSQTGLGDSVLVDAHSLLFAMLRATHMYEPNDCTYTIRYLYIRATRALVGIEVSWLTGCAEPLLLLAGWSKERDAVIRHGPLLKMHHLQLQESKHATIVVPADAAEWYHKNAWMPLRAKTKIGYDLGPHPLPSTVAMSEPVRCTLSVTPRRSTQFLYENKLALLAESDSGYHREIELSLHDYREALRHVNAFKRASKQV